MSFAQFAQLRNKKNQEKRAAEMGRKFMAWDDYSPEGLKRFAQENQLDMEEFRDLLVMVKGWGVVSQDPEKFSNLYNKITKRTHRYPQPKAEQLQMDAPGIYENFKQRTTPQKPVEKQSIWDMEKGEAVSMSGAEANMARVQFPGRFQNEGERAAGAADSVQLIDIDTGEVGAFSTEAAEKAVLLGTHSKTRPEGQKPAFTAKEAVRYKAQLLKMKAGADQPGIVDAILAMPTAQGANKDDLEWLNDLRGRNLNAKEKDSLVAYIDSVLEWLTQFIPAGLNPDLAPDVMGEQQTEKSGIKYEILR